MSNPFDDHTPDDNEYQGVKKRKPAEHTIIISFSIFCSECGRELRAVTAQDRTGDMEYCPVCATDVKFAAGLAVNANTTAELRYTMAEMQRNMVLIHRFLSEWSASKPIINE